MSLFKKNRAKLERTINQLRQQLIELEQELEVIDGDTPGTSTERAAVSTLSLMDLSDTEGQVFSRVNQFGRATCTQIANTTAQTEAQVGSILESLINRGLIMQIVQGGTSYYEVATLRRQARTVPADLWDLLESRTN